MSLEQALSYHMYIVVFNPEDFIYSNDDDKTE